MPNIWTLLTDVLQPVQSAGLELLATRLPGPAPYPPQTQHQSLSVEVVRPDDLLVLTLDFYNLRVTPAAAVAPAQLERDLAGNAFIIARFPPQSFAERAFFEAETEATSEALASPPVASRIAGPSQLVFRLTDPQLPLEFSLEAILGAIGLCEPVTQSTVRQPPGVPPLGGPGEFGGARSQFSAIEAPFRLVLSPNRENRWSHAVAPVKDAAGKRIELWHTRLTPGAKAGAVWSPDYTGPAPIAPAGTTPENEPFRTSLLKRHRDQIVRLSADRDLFGATQLELERLMLSSQGAWLSVHGQWLSGLTEWRQIMTGGRDQYARVVEEGYLFPLGHRSVLVTITERKVLPGGSVRVQGGPMAYLRQRQLIYVREPLRTYQHRDIPFRTVRAKTFVTPKLDPHVNALGSGAADAVFWPQVTTRDFLFHFVGTDWDGREIEFHAPQLFVIGPFAEATTKPAPINSVIALYNALTETSERRTRDMSGQKIAFAPSAAPGDTTLETAAMAFGASGATGSPHFLPWMTTAKVDVPAVRQISRSSAPSTIKLDPDFAAGIGQTVIGNKADVFARLVGTQTPVKFTPDQTGGVVAPDFDISGISRGFGPVGGKIDEFAQGKFNPADMFKDVLLLGGIKLSSIISDTINATPLAAGAKIPNLKTIKTNAVIGGVSHEVAQTKYHWDVDQSFLVATGMYQPKAGSRFFIEAVLNTPLDGSPPDLTVHGELANFSVVLLPAHPLIGLDFTKVSFTAGTNKKVDFAVVFDGFKFKGDLAFVDKLREVIPMDGFDDPPFLDLILPPDPHPGVNVGFTQGIPSVGIGLFTLQNISFTAGFYLPFINDTANLHLAFCERHQPFTLTVSLFGGGGFFALDIGMAGVKLIEMALEFGASIALNLGVASGSATIMGGVYFQKSAAGFAISAYFRAAGSLSVLGLITVSVEFYLALNYQSDKGAEHGGKLWGQASLTVKIKIAFFSKSVSISIEREFAGSDPKFLETVSPAAWTEYCDAFADYPA